ncbi:paREP10 [Pyrobaculum oguniense TE7]|uniref:PaREP10 n=1 Tax=Pyrobaculum oguniense (strain DSM 13380 / JCM 10595 / TE7) TaxID=698757 RepID=H6Q6F2_PYROT|nr:paREP10 [Pyrobaculum oguniense TE7]
MARVIDVLGPHAYTLVKYGVSPYDDVKTAAEKLEGVAPHLARLLSELGVAYTVGEGI